MTTETNITTNTHLFDLPERFDTCHSLGIFVAAGLSVMDYAQAVLYPLIPSLCRDKWAKPIRYDHLLTLCEYTVQLAETMGIQPDYSTIVSEFTRLRTQVCERFRKLPIQDNQHLVIIWMEEPCTIGFDFVEVKRS